MKAKTKTAGQTATPRLRAALERSKRFEAELKTAEHAAAAELLAVWKEFIGEELLKLLRVTKDPAILGQLETSIALGQEIEFGSRRKE